MARTKKQVKVKEPVRLRFNELKDGRKSIYLDIYYNGRRTYQSLKLYLVPETDVSAQIQNANTLAIANVNPEKPDVPLNKNDAFQKVQKRRVQEKR